jgi:hypothetical protein
MGIIDIGNFFFILWTIQRSYFKKITRNNIYIIARISGWYILMIVQFANQILRKLFKLFIQGNIIFVF